MSGWFRRLKWWLISVDNYRLGFKRGPVRRCRVCDHTVYRLPCEHCLGFRPRRGAA